MATMSTNLVITAAAPDPALLDLPWQIPLEDWPESLLAALPRGISRHTVRFVKLSNGVLAVKEIDGELAEREYGLLRLLRRIGMPVVEPVGVVRGRTTLDGEPIESALVTRHLQFSLPYRALFSQSLRTDTATRLVDALAVLLVRLHLNGFYWGDVSLSNALFRRDAGSFAAYLVDAETGETYQNLSRGQREYDVELASINIAGECMDLQAGGYLDEDFDAVGLGQRLTHRYRSLWAELTEPESFERGERWRVDARIRRLNELGFDVGELTLSTDIGGTSVVIEPKVVDAGHHSRRLLRLTGLDVEENQARRLLNDLDTFVADAERQGDDEELLAHEWVNECYETVMRAVPRELRAKLEPAELYHEVLEHRWYLSEQRGHDVGLTEAVAVYVSHVLPLKRDESSLIVTETAELPVVEDDPL
jgi:tRNA A-37 threonylcarbamoyl transferase component Bud32